MITKHLSAAVGVTLAKGVRIKYVMYDLPNSDPLNNRLQFFVSATSVNGGFGFEWQCTKVASEDPAVTKMLQDAAVAVYEHLTNPEA